MQVAATTAKPQTYEERAKIILDEERARAKAYAAARPDASAPAAWGSSMYESAVSMLEKMRAEERALLGRLEEAVERGDEPLMVYLERQLTTERPDAFLGLPVPLRIRIAEMEAQIRAYQNRADNVARMRAQAIRDRR